MTNGGGSRPGSLRIAVIGGGISGIGAAKVLRQLGHSVTLYERAGRVGGVWLTTYPGVRLQNVAQHYRFSDFDWPFPADEHPTGEQVLRYLDAAVQHYGLDVRLGREVVALSERPGGWMLAARGPDGEVVEAFDRVVVAVGLFSGDKPALDLPGLADFTGRVLTERDIEPGDRRLSGTVAVVGFGKTAVDIATMAALGGARVEHIFRAPRWLMPRRLFGRGIGDVAAARTSATWTPAWVHPRRGEALLHRIMPWAVRGYWKGTEWLFRSAYGLHPLHVSREARRRMKVLKPEQPLTYQMRAAAALAPDDYYRLVRTGAIMPHRGSVAGLTRVGVRLGDGREIVADSVVLAIGYAHPAFAFLPERYRVLMTGEEGGTQLYRHVIHPRIPNLAFAGYNHCFLHPAGVEVGTLWYGAVLDGSLSLPTVEQMEASARRVAEWKATHTLFEPTRAYGVGGRFHQYFDVLLAEIGVNPHRKRNPLAEEMLPYWARDYAGIVAEYQAARGATPRASLSYDT